MTDQETSSETRIKIENIEDEITTENTEKVVFKPKRKRNLRKRKSSTDSENSENEDELM